MNITTINSVADNTNILATLNTNFISSNLEPHFLESGIASGREVAPEWLSKPAEVPTFVSSRPAFAPIVAPQRRRIFAANADTAPTVAQPSCTFAAHADTAPTVAQPQPFCTLADLSDLDILARTIYGEARGEFATFGIAALIGIGNVVANRVKCGGWFGRKIAEVCLKPKQFSCWNAGDPNFAIVRLPNCDLEDQPVFRACEEVALHTIRGDWPDLTKGADHYYAKSIRSRPPLWSHGKMHVVKIGGHLFFKLGNGRHHQTPFVCPKQTPNSQWIEQLENPEKRGALLYARGE
jgi:spore germination cell wall hydrolase CwlJ-like protein